MTRLLIPAFTEEGLLYPIGRAILLSFKAAEKMAMSDSYYIKRGQKTIGPYDASQLEAAIRSNKLTGEDLAAVAKDGPWGPLRLISPQWFGDSSHRTDATNKLLQLVLVGLALIWCVTTFIFIIMFFQVANSSSKYHAMWNNTEGISSYARSIRLLLEDLKREVPEALNENLHFAHERVSWKNLAEKMQERSGKGLRLVGFQRTWSDPTTGRAVYDLVWASDEGYNLGDIRREQRELEEKAEELIEEALRR